MDNSLEEEKNMIDKNGPMAMIKSQSYSYEAAKYTIEKMKKYNYENEKDILIEIYFKYPQLLTGFKFRHLDTEIYFINERNHGNFKEFCSCDFSLDGQKYLIGLDVNNLIQFYKNGHY